ncbi:MAG: rane protein [Clostridiaceae bacterium]|jgi:membrane AbrB-like protein|nr:rane protein [Clostridiaceae bacterium]
MIKLIITLVVGITGGIAALKLKIPAGAMIGSMLCVALYNVITGNAFLPQDIRVITQIAAGAFIGSGIKYKDVQDLKLMIKPAVLMVSSMMILDLFMGYLMYKITGIDLVTSLFASAPGGLMDMTLISADLGADTSKVAVLQMARLMTVMIIFPPIIKFVSSNISKKKEKNVQQLLSCTELDKDPKDINKKSKDTKKKNAGNLMLTLMVASAAGYIGYISKIPAGAMTFALISSASLNVIFSRGYMPLNLRRLTQMFAGVLIGERMTYADIIALKSVIIPVLILLIGIIIINLCIGIFINKAAGLEIVTSLFASAPGGVSDMALIAEELGADAPKVAILQLARYVCIIGIFPILIKLLCS